MSRGLGDVYKRQLLEDAKIMVEDILSKNPKLENIEGDNLRNLLYLQERDAAIMTLTAG